MMPSSNESLMAADKHIRGLRQLLKDAGDPKTIEDHNNALDTLDRLSKAIEDQNHPLGVINKLDETDKHDYDVQIHNIQQLAQGLTKDIQGNLKQIEEVRKTIQTLSDSLKPAREAGSQQQHQAAIEAIEKFNIEWTEEFNPLGKVSSLELPKETMEELMKEANKVSNEAEKLMKSSQKVLEARDKAHKGIEQSAKLMEQRREQRVSNTLEKVDSALNLLGQKIGGDNKHQNKEALAAANTLLSELRTARNTFESNLNGAMPAAKANEIFTQNYKNAIEKARPFLENDLSKWQSIMNFVKDVAKALVSVVSKSASEHKMFKKAESTSMPAVEETKSELNRGPR
ncbi:hypothetical protein [Legionella sp. W05-934-2]|uniref:hypothetical protein n=1 Tax=Legionella sp. W05-934-2 TaxID=1198649 RepID=UPI003461ED9D